MNVVSLCRSALLLLSFAMLSACFHEEEEKSSVVKIGSPTAVLTTENRTDGTGALVAVATGGDHNMTNDILSAQGSDLRVVTHGDYVYRIDRTYDTITKLHIDDLNTVVDEYSVAGDETFVNPYTLAFSSDTQAYVVRWGSNKIWKVDFSLSSAENFKIGELDVSAYADSDGIANPSNAVIVDGKLFVALQNIDYDNDYYPADAYVVVFDVASGEQIDTDSGTDGIQAIRLAVENPTELIYNSASNELYVQGAGYIWVPDYSGGIEAIDLDDYSSTVIVDDDTDTGAIIDMVIVSETLGYFVGYADWEENYLFQFNPSTGEVISPSIAAFDGKDISDIEVDDASGMLWLASFKEAGIYIMDTTDNTLESDFISTGLGPSDIAFLNGPFVRN